MLKWVAQTEQRLLGRELNSCSFDTTWFTHGVWSYGYVHHETSCTLDVIVVTPF